MFNWSTHPALAALAHHSICIIGLAREGLATYHFLRATLPTQVFCLADSRELTALDPEWSAIKTTDSLLEWHLGAGYLSQLNSFHFLFVTPGIRTDQPAIQEALNQGSKLHSNTQLFFELCPCPIIGVTGTKGKSTTTTLIHQVLARGGKHAVLLGNIGVPPLSGLSELTADSLAVLELSAHQLQHLPYSPHISVIQDVTAEHLDYYPTVAAYVTAKTAIARYQNSTDYVIFNRDFSTPTEIAGLGQAQRLTFSLTTHDSDQVVWLENDQIMYQGEALIATHQIPLPGTHNLLNVIPAIIIGKHYNLSNQQITDVIRTFRSLPHRLELVGEVDGVRYFNDSLATEPNATIHAIESFEPRPVILLAGGYERHQDYTELAKRILSSHVKTLILFPTTGTRLWENIESAQQAQPSVQLPEHYFVSTMAEAMVIAKQTAQAGDIVLLSPAAASFNTFKDYRDRGEQFRQEVLLSAA